MATTDRPNRLTLSEHRRARYTLVLGASLAYHRRARGFSQTAVAEHIGVTQSTYGRYEGGLVSLPVDLLRDALGFLSEDIVLFFAFVEKAHKIVATRTLAWTEASNSQLSFENMLFKNGLIHEQLPVTGRRRVLARGTVPPRPRVAGRR